MSQYHDRDLTRATNSPTKSLSAGERIFIISFISIAFIFVTIITCCCSFYFTRRRRALASVAAASPVGSPGNSRLDPEILSSIPVFAYEGRMCEEERVECAVCLMEFKEGEKGAALPVCRHKFHVECISLWFDSHSTCPLCRLTVESEHASLPV